MKYKYIGNVTPYSHQEEILDMSFQHDNLALLHEVGCGKTFSMINILRYRYAANKRLMRTLILSPIITLNNWQREILKFSKIKEEDIVVLDCNGHKRTKKFLNAVTDIRTKELTNNKIVIVNYEALQTERLFDAIQEWKPEVIVADESHRIKNPKAKRSKATVRLGDKALHRYILTGTPFLNNVTDIFGQYRFLDKGRTFGKNEYVFKELYMRDANAGFRSKPQYFPKYEPRPEMFEDLQKKVLSIGTSVTKADAIKDLPPFIKTVRHIPLSKEQEKMYKQMKDEFITFINDNKDQPKAVVAQLTLTKALRLQQITTGFVKTDDGEEIELKTNPRLTAVKELLDEILPNKVILWCCFRKNYEQLERLCKKEKIRYVMIIGNMTQKEKQQAMDDFCNDDSVKVAICNRRVGIGVNLVEASYSIVYSRNFSLEEEIQSEGRNYRPGSQIHESVTKIDLVTKDTIDEVVLAALQSKNDMANAIIKGVVEK